MRSKHAFAIALVAIIASPLAIAGSVSGSAAQQTVTDSWLEMVASEPCMNGYVAADGMPDARFADQLAGTRSPGTDEAGS
jgi:hypothetical protein